MCFIVMYFEGIVEGPLRILSWGLCMKKRLLYCLLICAFGMRDRFIAKAIGCEIYRAIC